MTYFGFLLTFLAIPIALLIAAQRWTLIRHKWASIGLMVALALVYTTPWDNYLVATRVWWYDPKLVTGLVLGWVPIEEYTFFVLQPILVGLWLLLWQPRMEPSNRVAARGPGLALAGAAWLGAVGALLLGWQPGTYLALELAWALPPIMLQLAFGGDLLWRYGRLVLVGILPVTLYLSAADALAIGWGTWTIDPAQSTGLLLGGVLPVEEFIFFLLTNTLVTFGLVLIWAPESRARLAAIKQRWLPGEGAA
jgi:lycopene beta-cyclase